jgi:putative DNA primase/helicase
VLAAATRIPYLEAPLQPAWALLTAGGIEAIPVIAGVERLIVLVDHDVNGVGQAAAQRCEDRWTGAGCTVVQLTPDEPGADFNDLIMEKV